MARTIYRKSRQYRRLLERIEAKEQRQVDRLDALKAAMKKRRGKVNGAWKPRPHSAHATPRSLKFAALAKPTR